MSLTHCYKTSFFTFIFAVFLLNLLYNLRQMLPVISLWRGCKFVRPAAPIESLVKFSVCCPAPAKTHDLIHESYDISEQFFRAVFYVFSPSFFPFRFLRIPYRRIVVVSFCVGMSRSNRSTCNQVMMSYRFSRWQPGRHNIQFRILVTSLFRRSKCSWKPNFVNILIHAFEVELLPVWKNKRWNQLPFTISTLSASSACHFILHWSNKFHPNKPTRGGYMMSCRFNFQNGGRSGAILFPASDWATSYIRRSLQNVKVSAYQLSSVQLSPRLRNKYFQFQKINVCHIGILLPVSISTTPPSSVLYSPSDY